MQWTHLTKVLGGIMIACHLCRNPYCTATSWYGSKRDSCYQQHHMSDIFPAILTLLGGTVGGYITFAGAHRLDRCRNHWKRKI